MSEQPENENIDDLIENQKLKEQLKKLGITNFGTSLKNIKEQNNFLRIVLEQEEMLNGDTESISNLFEASDNFPLFEDISIDKATEILNYIETKLESNNIIIDLQENLPIEIRYTYIVYYILRSDKPVNTPQGAMLVHDGCDGDCENCFQLKYCDIGKEIMNKDK